MKHTIKIEQCHLIHILENRKSFEIRENDRDYQVGDIISFLPLESDDYDVYEIQSPIPDYKIDYILSDFQGLELGYVIMSISSCERK